MRKLLRPIAVLALTVSCVAWAMTGCAPVHRCNECPPKTHAHSDHLGCPSCGRMSNPTGPVPAPHCDHR